VGKPLSPVDARLYRLCDEALYYIWDPVGVAGVPEARDEYYAYLPHVFGLVKARQRPELLRYLRDVSEEHMGLSSTDRTRRERAADFMFGAQEWIGDPRTSGRRGHVTSTDAD
jgi:hypothetical protein